ncbi:Carbon storage regulator [Klebsiella pneumoniae]|uniref:carbon storage regulator n=1 Tax=Klebsiella pneumoniae complex TaxID=3390273 RepID=UPI000D745404|nr:MULTISPECIES: carbon storage regulator [Klebsiella]MCZ9588313.1 carbon storage regulator [Klebsiella pneumoniae]MDU4079366.1 carbon storage regulator [Klebsiella pneumoniae]PXL94993.1 carbon storage regulator [Klebsiella variicola]VGB98182.1 Carbon storage regulator [Klebsiella pneumoniae]VGD35914.1 Carbon storage regulator [Klebsiella pneumoniae]
MRYRTLFDGESLYIGDSIKIIIDRCVNDGNKTRLGIDAPKDVTVVRKELISRESRSKT